MRRGAADRERPRADRRDLRTRHGRPVADSADLPHLAAALIDGWYRRGYRALLARMTQVTAERPTVELAGHWTALTGHQQTAETRWLAIRDTLSRI